MATNNKSVIFLVYRPQNLVFLFNPTAVVADVLQTTTQKALCCAVRLGTYSYICGDIAGSLSFWANINSHRIRPSILRRIFSVPILPSSSADDFIWLSSHEGFAAQTKHRYSKPSHVLIADDGLHKDGHSAIRVSNASEHLLHRLCIVAHIGPNGH